MFFFNEYFKEVYMVVLGSNTFDNFDVWVYTK